MNSSDPITDSGKLAMGEILLRDAEMAVLFIRIAENGPDCALNDRRLKAAAKAYDRIIAFMPRVWLTVRQMALLEQRLSVLRSHLKIHSMDVTH